MDKSRKKTKSEKTEKKLKLTKALIFRERYKKFKNFLIKHKDYKSLNFAVENFGCALQFIDKQDENLCLKAVQNDGIALFFVKKQTFLICREAIRQNPHALFYVNNQTDVLCDVACSINPALYFAIRDDELRSFYHKKYLKSKRSKKDMLKDNQEIII